MRSRRDLVPSDPYYQHWQLLAKVQHLGGIGVMACIFGSAAFIHWVVPRLGWVRQDWVILLPIGIFVCVCMLPFVSRAGMPCPRCGKPFFMRVDSRGSKRWGNSLARRCLNCALPLWQPGAGHDGGERSERA